MGSTFSNTLFKERYKIGQKRREDVGEDLSSYWMALRKREDTGN